MMKAYLERVVADLPAFLSTFVACLSRPRKFLVSHLAADGPTIRDDAAGSDKLTEKGVAFLITAFLIAFFLSIALPEVTNPLTLPSDDAGFIRLGTNALLSLFLLLASVAITHGVLRLFGTTTPFSAAFGVACYFCGVALILGVGAAAMTNIAMVDPFVARSWIQMEQASQALGPDLAQLLRDMDPVTGALREGASIPKSLSPEVRANFFALQQLLGQAMERPLFRIAFGLQTVASVAILLWLLIAWFSYCKIQALSTYKILLATLVSGAALGVGYLLYIFITTAPTVMQLYRTGTIG
ncbi:MAG: hypothetical protein ACK5X9_05620 [Alphaproteobacteria bacterium]|jgi:hypothetical protein